MKEIEKANWHEVEYGLLIPDGRLFECSYEGHCDLAESLVHLGILNGAVGTNSYYGAVHIADGEFDQIRKAFSGRYDQRYYERATKVTHAQREAMFDFVIAKKQPFDPDIF